MERDSVIYIYYMAYQLWRLIESRDDHMNRTSDKRRTDQLDSNLYMDSLEKIQAQQQQPNWRKNQNTITSRLF